MSKYREWIEVGSGARVKGCLYLKNEMQSGATRTLNGGRRKEDLEWTAQRLTENSTTFQQKEREPEWNRAGCPVDVAEIQRGIGQDWNVNVRESMMPP